mmetsp:Transcript_104680/g.265749  ORF Transcript_104680/g.265749 Transcript_104680/m.265749 type:complete len:329 (-) Transcript_104680:226-1212(-)|eukprot:CAMPEP_0183507078 /NCGR_PEP_ID=MMETSP0371-20130417/7950_1 /TAXON_ID=268820 /ORGANISM="Peridinium aciculiferum, Strain PAER-2" /LENGTH=328 /DNA_ID=CAMNT_0025703203 /DNA_START=54 /DNA_END=1040 /DNA_ORIENTATION=-
MPPWRQDAGIDDFLKPLGRPTHLSWEDYLAPEDLKRDLQSIPVRLDPEFRERLAQSREKMWNDPSGYAPGIPIVLFHGPPGTGKTFAMKVLAAQAGLQSWTLDVVGLQERSWAPETLFADILQKIEGMEGAIIFMDECESFFSRREVLSQFASVYVQGQKKMITHFIKWAEGLETKRGWEARRVILCLATNMPNKLDPAIRDRARVTVQFPLPIASQCSHFWAAHAKHLSHREIANLGSASEGLSFRSLNSIAEKLCILDAEKAPPPVHRPGEPSSAAFKAEIQRCKADGKQLWQERIALYYQVAKEVLWQLAQGMYLAKNVRYIARL